MPDDRTTRASTDAKRIDELVTWARSRIDQCRRDEDKFFSQAGGKQVGGGTFAAGDAGICAAQERRTLQAVLKILGREP